MKPLWQKCDKVKFMVKFIIYFPWKNSTIHERIWSTGVIAEKQSSNLIDHSTVVTLDIMFLKFRNAHAQKETKKSNW